MSGRGLGLCWNAQLQHWLSERVLLDSHTACHPLIQGWHPLCLEHRVSMGYMDKYVGTRAGWWSWYGESFTHSSLSQPTLPSVKCFPRGGLKGNSFMRQEARVGWTIRRKWSILWSSVHELMISPLEYCAFLLPRHRLGLEK